MTGVGAKNSSVALQIADKGVLQLLVPETNSVTLIRIGEASH